MENGNESRDTEGDGYRSSRDVKALQNTSVLYFTVTIAAIGAMLMSVTSSPTAKGASFLWLPAALQLIAGVWLGPVRGMIAGGLGAYAAGILCYGGWGIRDILMNLIAGGVTNAFLPAILFRLFSLDPSLSDTGNRDAVPVSTRSTNFKAGSRIFFLLWVVIIVAFTLQKFNLGLWGYIGPFFILLISPLVVLETRLSDRRQFLVASLISTFASACSALIGSYGQVMAGQTWTAAVLGTGIGWFLGNATSCILGLYVLATFTESARNVGIVQER